MNKAILSRQIDHALKAANHNKNVIKGNGWKGRGSRYYTGGFIIGTSLPRCVTVGYRVPYELLPLKLTMVDDSELTDEGIAHKHKIEIRTRAAIDAYKVALAGFVFEENLNKYGLPYLIVIGTR